MQRQREFSRVRLREGQAKSAFARRLSIGFVLSFSCFPLEISQCNHYNTLCDKIKTNFGLRANIDHSYLAVPTRQGCAAAMQSFTGSCALSRKTRMSDRRRDLFQGNAVTFRS